MKKNILFSNIKYANNKIWSVNPTYLFCNYIFIPIMLISSFFTLYESKLLLNYLDSQLGVNAIVLAICGICFVEIILQLLTSISSSIIDYQTEKTRSLLYHVALKNMCRVDYDQIESPEHKNIYSQYLSYSSNSVRTLFNKYSELLKIILSIFIYGTVISTLHPFIIIILIFVSILFYFVKRPIGTIRQKMNLKIIENNRKFQYITEISNDYDNAKEVRLYQMSEWLNQQSTICINNHFSINHLMQKKILGFDLTRLLVSASRDLLVYIYLIVMFVSAEITAGDFVFYFSSITAFSSALNNISSVFADIHKSNLEVSELHLVENISSSRNKKEGIKIPNEKCSIEFQNVSFRYPNSTEDTLKNISFKINAGEKIALVGVNGAGKTTLIKLLCGLYIPTAGKILINGHPVDHYNIEDYYSIFSVVFQNVNILPYSIACNIACTIDEFNHEKMQESIILSGLLEKVESLPNGIHTYIDKEVNENAIDLSGGEKQKIALARAIYMNRPILILDEPTAALDPIAENKIYQQYNNISKEKTSIFISHRLASTMFCDRIILLDQGIIIGEGPHKHMIENCKKYQEMFYAQSQYYSEDI